MKLYWICAVSNAHSTTNPRHVFSWRRWQSSLSCNSVAAEMQIVGLLDLVKELVP